MIDQRLYKIVLLLMCSLILFLAPSQDKTGSITFDRVDEKYFHNARRVTLKTGKQAYRIKDLTYEHNKNSRITDLVLSFNEKSELLKRDDTKKYRINTANYTFVRDNGALGKGCALFSKNKHRVIIDPVDSLWLGSCGDLGSFTLEFRIKMLSVKDSVIFSRIGYGSGKKKGIDVSVNSERFLVRFHSLFKKDESKYESTWLRTSSGLEKNKWYHVLLSFNRISGKLMLRVNNREAQVRYMTDSGQPYNGVYAPMFNDPSQGCTDLPPVIIGRDFSGYLDEFRISYIPYSVLQKTAAIAHHDYKKVGVHSRYPFNSEGVITSPVYAFDSTGTKVTQFKWKEQLPENSFIWMEFRISDKLFSPFDDSYRWYRIKNNQRNIYLFKKPDGLFLRGKYYQWRAHLVASPDGTASPALFDVSLNYKLDMPPNAPLFLEVIAADKMLYLKWKKNVTGDLGGYRIYYGVRSEKYTGIISTINGKRLNNSFAKNNYITVAINNDLIEQNKKHDKRKLLTYPLIRNTVVYYFAVTAYDSYRMDTPYNHESDFSKEVSARPFGGTEIK